MVRALCTQQRGDSSSSAPRPVDATKRYFSNFEDFGITLVSNIICHMMQHRRPSGNLISYVSNKSLHNPYIKKYFVFCSSECHLDLDIVCTIGKVSWTDFAFIQMGRKSYVIKVIQLKIFFWEFLENTSKNEQNLKTFY